MSLETHFRLNSRFWGVISGLLFCALGWAGEPAPKPENSADLQTNSAYLLELAQVHFRYRAFEQAAALLQNVPANATADQKFQAQQLLAQISEKKRDFPTAIKIAETLAASQPEGIARSQTALYLAGLYQQAGEHAAAEKTLLEIRKQLTSIDNQLESRWLKEDVNRKLLELWARTPGRLEAAIKESEAALAANPKDEAALKQLASIYASYLPNPAKEAEVQEKLAALNPENSEYFQRLLNAYRQSKQFDKALVLCKQRLAGLPKAQAQRTFYEIGQILLEAGRKEEALAWMAENFEKTAQTLEDYSLLNGFYMSAQLPEKGEELLAKALPLSRSSEEKASLLLRILRSAVKRNDGPKAEKLLTDMQTEFKDKPAILNQAQAVIARLKTQPKPQAAPPAEKK